MASIRRSFRWSSENKKTITVAVPRSESGFGFTVAWTKPPLVDYIHEGGNAEKAGLMPGDKIICIDKIKVSKKGKEEIETIVKNVKEIMELEISRPESELATRKRQTSLRRKESFTKKGSKMIIQDCNIMLWRRERALLKLLLCEEDLLTAISQGKELFIMGLRKRCSLATPMELSILFGNIEEVATVHDRCIQQLRQMTQGNDDSIGRLYQKQLDDRCSVLRTYVYGLHLAKILLKYKMSNKPFREFIEKHEKEEGGVEVSKLIEKPVQYIADVTTQLETLLSCTAVGHRDYVCLESVVSVLKNFGSEMNEVMSKLSCFVDFDGAESPYDDEDPYVNLEILQEKAIFTKGPRNFSLVYPGRYWLFSGELSKIEGRHYIQYWALLLSDCLILTRRTEQRVLLILDEPIMLRSIYQASFDVKKCDTEFRILFAVENPKKAVGQRNQWLTWILRAPSVGIKLIWQTILTYQLSFYSTEALSTGSKASFVHARPLPGVKELLAKRNLKYEESSFVTLAEGSEHQTTSRGGSVRSDIGVKEPSIIQPKGGKIIFPLTKTADLLKEISLRKSKERSYFSLNENFVSANNAENADQQVFPRSKSFGNDIGDTIPFIDSSEETKDAADKTKDSADQTKDSADQTKDSSDQTKDAADQTKDSTDQTKDAGDQTDDVFLPNNESEVKPSDDKKDKEAAEPESAPDTPSKSDKYVQTDDSSGSPEAIKRTPRRRFPRLGTFERIKVEKKNASDLNTTSETVPSHTKTGTSFRHRRHIKTTVSKEMLLKSTALSPTNEDRDVADIAFPDESPAENKKKSKGIFSRFWRKESKAPELISVQKENKDVQESNLDEVSKSERPPDYESAVQTGPAWPEKTGMSDD